MNKQALNTFSKGVFPASSAFLLESPLRKLIKSPKKVADRLYLQSEQQVLEVGAGSGYYSQEVATRLNEGCLILLDIQTDMLVRAKHSLIDMENIELVLADAAFLPVTTETFDTVFMVTVLGEVSDKERALNEAYRVLRPGGLLSIGEQKTDPDFLSLKEVREIAEQASFVFEQYFGNCWNYTANFYKEPMA